jgi:AraC family transcriptional regulator
VSDPTTHEWSPHWYLWEGGFLAIGRSRGVIPPHSHHAIQIVLGADGDMRVGGPDGEWHLAPGAIIRPDVTHTYDGNGAFGAMLLLDPESAEGQWLLRSVTEDLTLLARPRVDRIVTELSAFHDRPQEAMEFAPLVRHTVQALCVGPPPTRQVDERVLKVLDAIRTSSDFKLSLEDAAAIVFLSPSRFAHLFTEHVGLPYRRYLLWRKLMRALVQKGRGLNLTEAAHAGGFSDSAHLTRTFYQMFGIPPTVMLQGELTATESPFRTLSETR